MPGAPGRTPPEKKRLSLTRERDAQGKSNKGFRTQWPKKKAASERGHRHAVKQTLTTDPDSERLPDRKPVRKWEGSAPRLDEKIAAKKTRRETTQKTPRKNPEARSRRRARRGSTSIER